MTTTRHLSAVPDLPIPSDPSARRPETADADGSEAPFTDPSEAQRAAWNVRQVEMLAVAFGLRS